MASVVALFVGALVAGAYLAPSLGAGLDDAPYTAPWAHHDAQVISWALHPDRCVTVAAEGQGGGVTLQLRSCSDIDPQQTIGSGDTSQCISVESGETPLKYVACAAEGNGQLRLELPSSGQGPIRSVAQPERCLTIQGSGAVDGEAITLQPCEAGSDAQLFLTPRPHAASAFVGANLGGWLVLEEWMWPAEMEAKGIHDEWSLIAAAGGPESKGAQDLMRNHWDTFLQPYHLDRLVRFGVTHVRIPFGYWLLDSIYKSSDGFVAGGEPYLARALAWMKRRRMRAVLDLHASPGCQSANSGFCGIRTARADFFLDADQYERGKKAVSALVDLILTYEENSDTSGVVMGIELLNEPQHRYWSTSPGIREFYQEMVPLVRQRLPADRYMIMLSFMDSPHEWTSEWMAVKRREEPSVYAGVVYDAHLYHLFGDNTNPWSTQMDTCKTCCRDTHILEPMWSRDVPAVVGEYALSTGFGGWDQDDFPRTNLENQLSLFNTTRDVVGSFIWNFRLLLDPARPQLYEEWSLIDLIDDGYLPPDAVYKFDLSSLCPASEDARICPVFDDTVHWNTPCEYQGGRMLEAVGELSTAWGRSNGLLVALAALLSNRLLQLASPTY